MQINLIFFLSILFSAYSCNPKSTVNGANPSTVFYKSLTDNDMKKHFQNPQDSIFTGSHYSTSQTENPIQNPAESTKIFQSSDGGKTWNDASGGLPSDLRILAAYGDDQELYLGYEKGIYRSKNHDHLQFTKDYIYNRSVEDFYYSSDGPYVLNYDKGIFKESLPTSCMWQNVFTSLNKEIFRSVNELSDGTVLIGTDNGLFKTTDKGSTWQHVYSKSMVVNLVESNGIIIAGTLDGIIRSNDNGSTWTLVLDEDGFASKTTLINGQFVAITRGKEKLKHLFPQDENPKNNIRISKDNGKTWLHMEQNLPSYKSIDDIVQAGDQILCSTNLGVFRTTNFGISWEKILEASDNNIYKLIVTKKKIFAVKMPVRGC